MDYKSIEKFLGTLFYSWGSDAPSEATWAGNDFLEVIEKEYSYRFKNKFSESYDDEFPDNNYEVVLNEIKTLIIK